MRTAAASVVILLLPSRLTSLEQPKHDGCSGGICGKGRHRWPSMHLLSRVLHHASFSLRSSDFYPPFPSPTASHTSTACSPATPVSAASSSAAKSATCNRPPSSPKHAAPANASLSPPPQGTHGERSAYKHTSSSASPTACGWTASSRADWRSRWPVTSRTRGSLWAGFEEGMLMMSAAEMPDFSCLGRCKRVLGRGLPRCR